MVKEMVSIGVKIIYYADDLIMYGIFPADFEERVSAALKKCGIGAEFALAKCSWVKRDGV